MTKKIIEGEMNVKTNLKNLYENNIMLYLELWEDWELEDICYYDTNSEEWADIVDEYDLYRIERLFKQKKVRIALSGSYLFPPEERD